MEEHPDYPETTNFTSFALKLIELVKQHPILYVKTPRTNKTFLEKIAIWEQIAKTLDTPVVKCKSKWRQIRDNYRRFVKSTKDCKSKYNDERLSFLKDHQNDVYFTQDDDLVDIAQVSDPVDEELEETLEYAVSKPKKRKLTDKLLEELSKERSDRFQLLKALTVDKQSGSRSSQPESAVHSFFRSMADVVVNFPPYMIAETRLEVCNLVTRMELRNEAQKGAIPGVTKVRIPPGKTTLQNVVINKSAEKKPQDNVRVQNLEVPKSASPVKQSAKESPNVIFTIH